MCLWSVHQSGLFAEGVTPGAKRNEMILGLAIAGAPHQPQESPRERTSAPFTLCSDHSCRYIQVTSPCPRGLDFRNNLGDSFIQCVDPFSLVRRCCQAVLGPWHGPLGSLGHSRQRVWSGTLEPPCVPKLGERGEVGIILSTGPPWGPGGLGCRAERLGVCRSGPCRAGPPTQGAHSALPHPHSLLSLWSLRGQESHDR